MHIHSSRNKLDKCMWLHKMIVGISLQDRMNPGCVSVKKMHVSVLHLAVPLYLRSSSENRFAVAEVDAGIRQQYSAWLISGCRMCGEKPCRSSYELFNHGNQLRASTVYRTYRPTHGIQLDTPDEARLVYPRKEIIIPK